MSTTTEWTVPAGLTPKGREAATVIEKFLKEKGLLDAGGGGKFYSPRDWAERGEEYGTTSVLVVTHDGGDHAPAFSWDYEAYDLVEELRVRLAEIGCFAEQCTSWYSAIYPI